MESQGYDFLSFSIYVSIGKRIRVKCSVGQLDRLLLAPLALLELVRRSGSLDAAALLSPMFLF